jgi:hypothetical protein
LSDERLEKLSLEWSESPGYFDTDNLISNESSFQHVIPALKASCRPGGAYIGVGPAQNFTYIAHVQPALAFIIDIRRNNLLLHLYFKEVFRRAETRAEFLSVLLGRPFKGDSRKKDASLPELMDQVSTLPPNREYFELNLERIMAELRGRAPSLTRQEDLRTLQLMAETFFVEGPDLKFRSHGRRPRSLYPTQMELWSEVDVWGQHRSYLAHDELYQVVRTMQIENRIIPLVGDLSGPKTLRKVAGYLHESRLEVSVLYVSNVEFYLFGRGRFLPFVDNLKALPVGEDSLLVRSFFGNWGRRHPETAPGYSVASMAQKVSGLLQNQEAQPYLHYGDLAFRDYLSNYDFR